MVVVLWQEKPKSLFSARALHGLNEGQNQLLVQSFGHEIGSSSVAKPAGITGRMDHTEKSIDSLFP